MGCDFLNVPVYGMRFLLAVKTELEKILKQQVIAILPCSSPARAA
jgi:hypothetical protein